MSRLEFVPRTQIGVAFPLTLTLSLGEREHQPSSSFSSSVRPANPAHCFALRLDTILPLPQGEGRGEGEGIELQPAVFFPAQRTARHT